MYNPIGYLLDYILDYVMEVRLCDCRGLLFLSLEVGWVASRGRHCK